MKEGDYLSAKGPKGRFHYKPNQVRAFGMIAGGTGITPMYQVARAILENPEDKTKIYLIYANVTYDDILLKEDLDRFALDYPDQFKVYYVLNQPPVQWNGGVGYVSKGMVEANLPPPADDVQVIYATHPPTSNGYCDIVS
jgi:cytochrome-b5 reductase